MANDPAAFPITTGGSDGVAQRYGVAGIRSRFSAVFRMLVGTQQYGTQDFPDFERPLYVAGALSSPPNAARFAACGFDSNARNLVLLAVLPNTAAAAGVSLDFFSYPTDDPPAADPFSIARNTKNPQVVLGRLRRDHAVAVGGSGVARVPADLQDNLISVGLGGFTPLLVPAPMYVPPNTTLCLQSTTTNNSFNALWAFREVEANAPATS